jgi:ATP-binding cassette, subfamily B, bacterial
MNFPFYRQEDAKDCGPTCLKIISAFYGKDCDIVRIREDAGFNEEGVSLFGLYNAALNLGFKAESVNLSFEELTDSPHKPAILHWGTGHFVVFVGTAIATPAIPVTPAIPDTPTFTAHASPSPPPTLTSTTQVPRPTPQQIIIIADPARKILRVTKDEFCRQWLKTTDNEGQPVGFALLLDPAGPNGARSCQ